MKNNEISLDINRFKKTIRRSIEKDRKHRELSFRPNELETSKTEIRINLDALKQRTSPMEEVKDPVKLKNIELKRRIKNLNGENPLDFTEFLELQQ